MSTEDTSGNMARVIDLSAARKAKEDAMYEPLTSPSMMHPAARALAKREAEENK